jgi:hypothetical protein
LDSTGELDDGDNDNNTNARLPDGTGNFTFQASTKGFPNQLTVIENKTSTSCIIENGEVELGVQVVGHCIEDVIFSVEINGNYVNFTGSHLVDNNYSVSINSSLLNGTGSFDWTVYTWDCFNRSEKNGVESFYVNKQTVLEVNPAEPDGFFDFYVNEPLFNLINSDAGNLWYQWDAYDIVEYVGGFGLENTPNNWDVTGGFADLNFWSDLCGNESKQERIFKFDFSDPSFKNLAPENNSEISDFQPEISVFIDELFSDNSGINLSSVVVRLDGIIVNASVIAAGDLDAVVSFTPSVNLSAGMHYVEVFARDLAGREGDVNWSFNVSASLVGDMIVNSPIDLEFYDLSRFEISISLTAMAEKIEYINYADKRPRVRRLCRNCEGYGFDRVRKKSFNQGWNNITFIATFNEELIVEKNVSFFVDSKAPRISRVFPKKNAVVNGSEFYIKYSEDNLVDVRLFWNPNVTFFNCTSGKNQECSNAVDLSGFDNQTIEYWFEVSDPLHITQSKLISVLVDLTSPNLTINSPVNGSLTEKRIALNISVSEEVDLSYMDLSDKKPRWKKLCRNCEDYGVDKLKKKRFSQGVHDVLIRAVDKAGNSDVERVWFDVALL